MKKLIAVFLCIIISLSFAPAVFAETGNLATPYEDSLFFEIGDYSIHYRVKQADAQKGYILFIHGFAMSGYCFENLSDIMRDAGYTCVLVDLPGYGYSTRETAATDIMPREEILFALTQSIHEGKWLIAGHSMGGYVALSMLAAHPEGVETLLLYGTSGDDGFTAGTKDLLSNELFVKMAGFFMETLAKSDFLVKTLLAAAFGNAQYVRDYDLEKITEPLRIKGTGAGAMYALINVTPTDYEAVSSFGKPILFVNGSEDNVIKKADRNKLSSYLPEGSQDIIIAGGYHLFIENMAQTTADVTLDFLGQA